MMDDHLAGWRAEMDQAVAALADTAHLLWAYYKQLVMEGFTDDQALTLVVHWQASHIAPEEEEGEG